MSLDSFAVETTHAPHVPPEQMKTRALAVFFSLLLFCGCATGPKNVAGSESETLTCGDCILVDVILNSVRREDLQTRHVVDFAASSACN